MKLHRGNIVCQRDDLVVIDCIECGYCHLKTFPTNDELKNLYQDSFWQTIKSGELALYEDRRAWWAMTHGDWLTQLEAHMVSGGGRVLLDVGCGYGFFLQTTHARGWETHGIEPSQTARDYCVAHGLLNIWRDGLDSGTLYRKFDAISALWLIEHLPNPLEFLQRCRQHLYSAGALLIVCPNEWTRVQADANAKVNKKFWWIDKTHLNYFNMATLGNLLGRAGFQVVEWLTTDSIENFITEEIGNYVDNPELGPDLHAEIEEWEMYIKHDQRIDRAIRRARRGEGRDIVAVARVDA